MHKQDDYIIHPLEGGDINNGTTAGTVYPSGVPEFTPAL
jgi:hypothetical protein